MEYILGVAASLLIQGLKKTLDTNVYGTYLIVLLISVAAAVSYTFMVEAGWWDNVSKILITAGAFHNFIIRPLEK